MPYENLMNFKGKPSPTPAPVRPAPNKYSNLMSFGTPVVPRGTASTTKASPEYVRPQPQTKGEEALSATWAATGLPAMYRAIEGMVDPEKKVSGWDIAGTAAIPVGAGLMKAGGLGLGQIIKILSTGAVGSGVAQGALGQESRSLAEDILAGGDLEPSRLRKAAAFGVEMAPSIAGGMAGPAIAGKIGNIYRGGPKMKTIPQGGEASELLRVAADKFGLPKELAAKRIQTTGELRGAMETGREAIGKPVGAARDIAYAQAQVPKDLKKQISGALSEGLEARKVPKAKGRFVTELAESPTAARTITKLQQSTVPKITDLNMARALQSRLAKAAEQARKPQSPTAPEANILSSAERSLDETIKSFIPKKALGDLEEANKNASRFYKLHSMVMKSSNAEGNFSPQKFIKAWNEMTPEVKAGTFSPEQIAALNALTKQPKLGPIAKLKNWTIRGVQILGARTIGRGTKFGRMLEEQVPSARFYQKAPTLGAAGAAGVAAIQNVGQMKKTSARQALSNLRNQKQGLIFVAPGAEDPRK